MSEALFAAASRFTERLQGCTTREEWDAAIYCVIRDLIAMQIDLGSDFPEEDNECLNVFMQLLKNGPKPRQKGRPRHDKEKNDRRFLFERFEPKTIADGARLLQRTETIPKILKIIAPFYNANRDGKKPSKQLTDSNAWKQAEETGYPFPEEGRRFGNQRKKP